MNLQSYSWLGFRHKVFQHRSLPQRPLPSDTSALLLRETPYMYTYMFLQCGLQCRVSCRALDPLQHLLLPVEHFPAPRHCRLQSLRGTFPTEHWFSCGFGYWSVHRLVSFHPAYERHHHPVWLSLLSLSSPGASSKSHDFIFSSTRPRRLLMKTLSHVQERFECNE